jgi:hypothetical protein
MCLIIKRDFVNEVSSKQHFINHVIPELHTVETDKSLGI